MLKQINNKHCYDAIESVYNMEAVMKKTKKEGKKEEWENDKRKKIWTRKKKERTKKKLKEKKVFIPLFSFNREKESKSAKGRGKKEQGGK